MADFTGFYFNNIHSSTYGLVRTSDGDRYKENLLPDFEDREIKLVGGDGDLYQGRRFKTKKFSIPVAFDHITEQQFRGIRQWLSGDQLYELRFDERPYKTYWVKPSKSPELEYICFMEDREDSTDGTKERVYKGEGSIEFTAYDPFGYCIDNSKEMTSNGLVSKPNEVNWQIVESYYPYNINNSNETEWAESAGLKDEVSFVNIYNIFSLTSTQNERYLYDARTYNPGDYAAEVEIFIKLKSTKDGFINIYFGKGERVDVENRIDLFQISTKNLKSSQSILLTTKKHTLAVYDENKRSLRYDLVKSAKWPTIPMGEGWIRVDSPMSIDVQIKYNYKYY